MASWSPRCVLVPPLSVMCPRCPRRESAWEKSLSSFAGPENDMKKSSQIVVKTNAYLTSVRVGFHRKSCACGVFVRVSFFVNLLTASGSLDPRSARAGAVETQFFNLRIIVKKCNFYILFLHILRHLDFFSFARNACKNKGKQKQEISYNLGPKTSPPKVIF